MCFFNKMALDLFGKRNLFPRMRDDNDEYITVYSGQREPYNTLTTSLGNRTACEGALF